MRILDNLVASSKSNRAAAAFEFDRRGLSPDELRLIRSISRNQRRRWREKGIVPQQVLQLFWARGIPVSDGPPQAGMSEWAFRKKLAKHAKQHPHQEGGRLAGLLYSQITEQYQEPDWEEKRKPRKYRDRVQPSVPKPGPVIIRKPRNPQTETKAE